jgi:AcrR family transcriptional regulator
METTTERRDARANRERILDAAREEFATKGEAAQMKDIALRADVGMPTIYRRFGSRDGLIAALNAEAIRDVLEMIRAAAAHEDKAKAFRESLGSYGRVVRKYGPFIAGCAPSVDARTAFADGVSLFKGIVDRGKDGGIFRADTDADFLLKIIGAVFESKQFADVAADMGYERAAESIGDLLLMGCISTSQK